MVNDLVMITEAWALQAGWPRIVFVNEAFVRLTGFSRQQVLDCLLHQLMILHSS